MILDANEGVARIAYALNEVIAIYPITPATSMGELADGWAAAGKRNLWGTLPSVIEMQSEGGAARALAAQGLSIFGDHSDVMAARTTGWAMLGSASVQEAQDFALFAQVATLESRIPFLHFFDGFRTSHEIAKIEPLSDDVLRAMIDERLIAAHRNRALSPDHPVLRGTAQNPDVYFQGREP